MSDMKDLAKAMKALEDQLVTCMRCGMCQSVCPLFDQTRKESDVARGKIVLLESLMEEMFDNPHGVNERLNKCLLCGSCAANCPSGVNVTQIFIEARAVITTYLKLPFYKKVVFRKMLARPQVFDKLISMGARIQKVFLSKPDSHTGTAKVKVLAPILKSRRIMPIADLSFQKKADALITGKKTTGDRVALFTGCLIDKIFPNVGVAAVKALLHNNARVHIPKNQGCCAIPALASGDKDTFLELVNHNIALFPPHRFDYLVTACATCTSTIKKLWPAMLEDQDPQLAEQVRHLSDKTLDISQYLVDVAGLAPLPETAALQSTEDDPRIVTYHDPCHLAKSLGVRQQPRTLLNACSGYTFKEMTEPDRCCGMGGSFNLYHYDLSEKIGTVKAGQIADTGCHTLATSCPACMMQISDMLSKADKKIFIKHPIELYTEGLDSDEPA